MAVASLPIVDRSAPWAEEAEAEVDVRLGVHDASRLEWSVSLPMPAAGRAPYSIDVEMEIPANVFARHLPWEKLQSWTRLDGTAQVPAAGQPQSADMLRRGAISFAHKLARASEGFARHCRLAGSVGSPAFTPASLEDGLVLWVTFADAIAAEARTRLASAEEGDRPEIARERMLVDEYISVRLLEMLASAERAIAALRESRTPNLAAYEAPLAHVEETLAASLEREVAHRDAQRWLHPDPAVISSLEAYIERSSRLKKHFQEVLFLEPETFQVAERVHNWVAMCVAVVASTWAFVWQIALMDHKPTKASAFSSGVLLLALLVGVVYAVKDRIKELGRAWVSRKVHSFYAQRVARWRAPAKRSPRRDVIVSARESFDQCVVRRPDPLNPEFGETVAATQLHFVHKGMVHATPELLAAGVLRVKHIFRYDFSALFARLDDSVKQVPVFDCVTRRLAFTDAPRLYRVNVRLRVHSGKTEHCEEATLVLHKKGLERLEFVDGEESEPPPSVLLA